MADIYFGLALIALLYVIYPDCSVPSRIRRPGVIPYAGVAAIGFVFFAIRIHDSVTLSRLLPFSNLIIVGDWLPLGAAALTALTLSSPVPPSKRRLKIVIRYVLVVLLNVAWLYYSYGNLLSPAQSIRNEWKNGVCLQSGNETCGPAAAATLLSEYGIAATEAEMARLCLSSRAGTSPFGIFRGLKIKTRGTAWDVELVSLKVADLRDHALPAILIAELKNDAAVDRRYSEEWGWKPGVPHAVVAFKADDKRIEIGDPAIGREHWPLDALDVLWHGMAFHLVPK